MTIPPPVQELIESSGNAFHAKVARWFATEGWTISISPYYMDQSQQKARELDLIVEKIWPIKGYGGDFQGDVVARLFVECKFVPGHSVFWFADKDREAIARMLCATGTFREGNTFTANHHYLASGDRVAKLFASSNSRGQEAEPFYKALNQALNGLVSMRPQVPRVFSAARRRGGFQVTLDFPVVVCNSFAHLYAADFAQKQETTPLSTNFQLDVEYAYVDPTGKSRTERFLLDVVEYEQLSHFVSGVAEDVQIAGGFARHD